MKKLAVLAFTILLGSTLAFGQTGGSVVMKPAAHKRSKKAPKQKKPKKGYSKRNNKHRSSR